MADYIYLLENRLSPAQQAALLKIRDVARTKGLTVFLVGGAVRDLTNGSPVRDLDVVVQGNALKLKKDIEKAGGTIAGESETIQAIFAQFPGSVRIEIASTLSFTYPKPGKPVVKPANILEDLRQRDFTANAMALSLNDGSYGLLMDPLNGVADIENRELRLVSNYGFIEDPSRMIRAVRFMARLGWQMEEKTRERYETGKTEGYISALSEFNRGYEIEEIFHEEDPLRVLKRLESEGWMKVLMPALSSTKANVGELERLRESQTQLQLRGIIAEAAAANFPLLTAKMQPKEVSALKKGFARQGFVTEIDKLEKEGKEFAAQIGGKGAATPSQAWKMLMSAKPEAVLWVAHTSKNAALQAKFKSFYTEWPQAQQKIPYTTMQEMRIVPELPGYGELLEKLFFELMDGKLSTPEEMKAFLEPYSPPAPPPPVHLRRQRVAKKETKPAKSRKKAAPEGDVTAIVEVAAEVVAVPVKAAGKVPAAKAAPVAKAAPAVKAVAKKAAPHVKAAPVKVAAKKAVAKAAAKKAVAKAPAKKVAAKAVAKKAIASKASVKTATKKPTAKVVPKKIAAKHAAKKAVKVPAKKAAAKAVSKKAVAKGKPAKKVAAPVKKKR
jgi:tRNA nucleotidyltransferase (CCA-adding enzyme)